MEAIKFKNYTDRDFVWSFDGVSYTFKAGQEMYMEDFKAHFFAKHLADEECNRLDIPTNDPRRNELEAKCFPADEAISVEEAIDAEAKKKPAKKAVKADEKEFEELDAE